MDPRDLQVAPPDWLPLTTERLKELDKLNGDGDPRKARAEQGGGVELDERLALIERQNDIENKVGGRPYTRKVSANIFLALQSCDSYILTCTLNAR